MLVYLHNQPSTLISDSKKGDDLDCYEEHKLPNTAFAFTVRYTYQRL